MSERKCVVCNLPETQACEMCQESMTIFRHVIFEGLSTAAQAVVDKAKQEPECAPAPLINIGSGEDVCLA